MSGAEVIENKISYIKKQLNILKSFQEKAQTEIEESITLRAAVERHLYLIAQAVVDLAEAVIAFKGFRKPTTLKESIEILKEERVIPSEFAKEFVKIVGFRNVLTHDYEDLDFSIVYDVLKNKLNQIEKFIEYIKEFYV